MTAVRRVHCISPMNLEYSGLFAYAQALGVALSRDKNVLVSHSSEPDSAFEMSQQGDIAVWIGYGRDRQVSLRSIEVMAALPHSIPQVVLPEWETHSTEELIELLSPVRRFKLLFIVPNNAAVGKTVVDHGEGWTGSPIPTPIDQRTFCAPSALSIENGGRLRFAYLGRDAPYKGIPLLVGAWKEMHLDTMASLDIYVPGSCSPTLVRSVENVDGVSLHSLPANLSPSRLEIYRRYHAYISASRFETGPIAAIEAMASGCALLLSDSPGHKDLKGKSEGVILYQKSAEIHEKIRALRSSSEGLIRMREANYRYAIDNHSSENVSTMFWRLVAQWF
ncbi:glycosyltransferase [Nocardia mangyaensis]|uniref:glycosyltransferase n=1 Tax=Nocardia mangyaensis TaxID=2213200 RepID=UPI000A01CC00|nr:glycosyltransferase [Nocardia mangyaensis]